MRPEEFFMFPRFIFRNNVVFCEDARKRGVSEQPAKVDSMIDLIGSKFTFTSFDRALDIMGEPGTYYGFTAGACTGFALKKVAKAAALTFGAVYIGFQMAAKSEYITVNWPKIENDIKRYLPEKREDESQIVSEAVDFLTTNTGIASAVFAAGFITGLKAG
jgi:uncharacterized membrane protein (Fun14 family)